MSCLCCPTGRRTKCDRHHRLPRGKGHGTVLQVACPGALDPLLRYYGTFWLPICEQHSTEKAPRLVILFYYMTFIRVLGHLERSPDAPFGCPGHVAATPCVVVKLPD